MPRVSSPASTVNCGGFTRRLSMRLNEPRVNWSYLCGPNRQLIGISSPCRACPEPQTTKHPLKLGAHRFTWAITRTTLCLTVELLASR